MVHRRRAAGRGGQRRGQFSPEVCQERQMRIPRLVVPVLGQQAGPAAHLVEEAWHPPDNELIPGPRRPSRDRHHVHLEPREPGRVQGPSHCPAKALRLKPSQLDDLVAAGSPVQGHAVARPRHVVHQQCMIDRALGESWEFLHAEADGPFFKVDIGGAPGRGFHLRKAPDIGEDDGEGGVAAQAQIGIRPVLESGQPGV